MAKLESLSKKCSKPPLFKFQGFIVRPFDEDNLFFENPDGEGTQISKEAFGKKLVEMLDELFKEFF